MTKKTNGPHINLTRQQIKQMSLEEKQAALVRYIFSDDVSEQMIDKLLDRLIESESSEKNGG